MSGHARVDHLPLVTVGIELLLEERGIRLQLEQAIAGGEAVSQDDDPRMPWIVGVRRGGGGRGSRGRRPR